MKPKIATGPVLGSRAEQRKQRRKRHKTDTRAGQRAPRAANHDNDVLDRSIIRGARAPMDSVPSGQEVFVTFTKKDKEPAAPESEQKTSGIWFDTTGTVSPVIRGARRPRA